MLERDKNLLGRHCLLLDNRRNIIAARRRNLAGVLDTLELLRKRMCIVHARPNLLRAAFARKNKTVVALLNLADTRLNLFRAVDNAIGKATDFGRDDVEVLSSLARTRSLQFSIERNNLCLVCNAVDERNDIPNVFDFAAEFLNALNRGFVRIFNFAELPHILFEELHAVGNVAVCAVRNARHVFDFLRNCFGKRIVVFHRRHNFLDRSTLVLCSRGIFLCGNHEVLRFSDKAFRNLVFFLL